MENQKYNKGLIALLIVIIVILATLCVLFATETISFKNEKSNNKVSENNNNISIQTNQNENNVTNENIDIINEYKLEAKTSVKVDLLWNGKYDIIEVNDGNLQVNDNTFSIANEKIKYFYLQRYQSSRTTVFHYLTESGNIYVIEFTYENTIDSFNNFIKLNYSNITDIVVLPNNHYGKTYDNSGIIDNRESYLYAVSNGEKLKLDYQYSY